MEPFLIGTHDDNPAEQMHAFISSTELARNHPCPVHDAKTHAVIFSDRVELFPDTDVLYRLSGDVSDRKRRAASCIAVELIGKPYPYPPTPHIARKPYSPRSNNSLAAASSHTRSLRRIALNFSIIPILAKYNNRSPQKQGSIII